MKREKSKIFLFTMVLLFIVLFLSGCTFSEKGKIKIEARYIRTDGGYDEEFNYPFHVLIESKEDLDAYYEANKEIFYLERGFKYACNKYDDAYFETKDLLLVVLEETSGSISHKVTGVSKYDGEWTVSINGNVPGAGSDDMAAWHLLIEIHDGTLITADDVIHIKLNDK